MVNYLIVPGRCGSNFKSVILESLYKIVAWLLTGECQRILQMKSEVNIGSGNGLLPGGTEPLTEPILTQQ